MAAGGAGCGCPPPPPPLLLLLGLVAAAGLGGEAARLYRPGEDPLTVLEAGTVRRALLNSSAAWVLQFYSSSCGHCIGFAPTWRALAGDVRDWEPAIRIGVLDCGEEENYETCKEYGILYYPTFRYFKAFTKQFTTGENYKAGSDRELQTVRQMMIDFLQNHSQESRPPACPPLDPIPSSEIASLFDKTSHHYTAIVVESSNSYVGRELFPGRQPVVKLLETLQEWLVSLPLDKIPYDAILDLVNNKMRISGIFLTNHIQWVGCQGSKPELRGYTCSLWKLFHTLTVQAAVRPKALINTGFEDNPQVVLQIMRRYIQHFFGCKACAQHFEEMAKESMESVKTLDKAVLWLWEKHNVVNDRLAGMGGDPSEDPKFPKVPWPTPDLCPECHDEIKGLHSWNEAQVLQFLKHHYHHENILYKYAEGQVNANEIELGDVRERKDKNLPKKMSGDKEDKILDQQNMLDSKSKVLDKLITNNGPVKDRGKNAIESVIHKETKPSVSFLGIGFSNIDMSLCVVLYVASSLFLMIMYFFFRMRSKRWKVRYYRPAV
ncbi:sulfhydryl oxidase 2 isoform X6 [Lepidochelys kempii]|uniref:sulfhydryl oxidase 2 isoform X6 n=1 Tax=Lepidochelys kempii TaxID=8472 RepID=UPI003C6FCFF8